MESKDDLSPPLGMSLCHRVLRPVPHKVQNPGLAAHATLHATSREYDTRGLALPRARPLLVHARKGDTHPHVIAREGAWHPTIGFEA